MKHKQHFETLDVMRAVAAVAVTLFHLRGHIPFNLPSAFLAVDMFFALSGFVIANAYDHRIAAGLGVVGFMKVRLIRLWPLAALGTVMATSLYVASAIVYGGKGSDLPVLVMSGLANLFFLPAAVAGAPMFVNPPAWSLMFELIVNALYAMVHRWLNTYSLIALMVIGLSGNVLFALQSGTLDVGANWPQVLPGMCRVIFSFSMGILLYRKRQLFRKLTIHPIIPLFLLFASLAVPFHNVAYDLSFVSIISPLLIISGANYRPVMGASYFGETSFVIYILHRPLQVFALKVSPMLGVDGGAAGIGVVVLLAILTPAISKFFDKPVRRFLSSLFLVGRSKPVLE